MGFDGVRNLEPKFSCLGPFKKKQNLYDNRHYMDWSVNTIQFLALKEVHDIFKAGGTHTSKCTDKKENQIFLIYKEIQSFWLSKKSTTFSRQGGNSHIKVSCTQCGRRLEVWPRPASWHTDKKENKISSYIRKFGGIWCKVIYD
jgi:hypothetical protein